MQALTRRQQAILEYLRESRLRQTHPPTLDELCSALGLRPRGSMHKHVTALVEAGYVEPLSGKQRGVRLSEAEEDDPSTLPLLGRIAAGRPIEAVQDSQELEVPRQLRGKGRCYVLQVRGDSMIEDGILDGDWVVIEQQRLCPQWRNRGGPGRRHGCHLKAHLPTAPRSSAGAGQLRNESHLHAARTGHHPGSGRRTDALVSIKNCSK